MTDIHGEARQRLGVTGRLESAPPLGPTLAAAGVSIVPLVLIGTLAAVDTLQGYAFTILAPEVSRTLGIGLGAVTLVVALKTFSTALSPLPMATLAQRRARRALLCVGTGIGWSVFAIATGLVTSLWMLCALVVVDGLSTGSVGALHQPLLLDTYPPPARMRALSMHQAAMAAANVVAPLAVAVLAGVLGFTWRGVFVILGVVSMLGALSAVGLRDPGFGRWDADEVRSAVSRSADNTTDGSTTLGFFEISRRLFLITTVRRILVAFAVFGVLAIPLQTFLSFFLADRWHVGPGDRGLVAAAGAFAAVAAVALFARRAEALFRADPGRPVRAAAVALVVGVAFVAAGGVIPSFPVMVVCFSLAAACIALVPALLAGPMLAVVPARMRPHAASLVAIALGGVGALFGALFLSGIQSQVGDAGTMVAIAIPGIAAAVVMASAAKFVGGDLDRMIDEVIGAERAREATAAGGHLPLLSCQGIDFSYGQLQVLFDIDFTIDDAEMVALLGVNGAGKSTLLKVISGIGLPSAGSIRLRADDITYVDAERRLPLGIVQVPGGRAVFGPMTVEENLRAYGYTLGRDRKAVDGAIERCLDVFPRLADRRHSKAVTLSGGEQQMLGLCKTLILRPKLVLIDELSLGLAPVIVGQLLDLVREINRQGVAVVLVEQSVNIALELADHAYFMEKGEMRFDGPSADLLDRGDLLRAVFLEGAGAMQ